MIEDIRVMVGILYDSMQAYIKTASTIQNTADIPAMEVDAMFRVYCNYLESMITMLDKEIDKI